MSDWQELEEMYGFDEDGELMLPGYDDGIVEEEEDED